MASKPAQQLMDSFGRVHTSLRISVTDRCNIRCFYCMPAEDVQFLPRADLLTFEEIVRTVRIGVSLGIRKLRLTGGEPLVRRDLPRLIQQLTAIDGVDDIGLTTNGLLLADQAAELRAAGLRRLNISLDALDPQIFRKVTRRDGFEQVQQGISAARDVGFRPIKINAVAIRGLTEDQLMPFGKLARETDTVVRFIEYMPLDADSAWERDRVLTAREILTRLEAEFGPLVAESSADRDKKQNASSQLSFLHSESGGQAPARRYRFADGRGQIGIIASVTEPFCSSCDRFRLTADGKLRNCLFSLEETDLRGLLRESADDSAIAAAMQSCIAAKLAGHGINSPDFQQPDRPMYSIGG